MTFLLEAVVPSTAFGRGGFSVSATTLGDTPEDETLVLAAAGALLSDQDGVFYDLLDGMVADGVLERTRGGMTITFDGTVALCGTLDLLERNVSLLDYLVKK